MRKFTPSVVLVLLIPILLLGLTLIYAQEQPKAPETPQAQETIKAPETPTPPQETPKAPERPRGREFFGGGRISHTLHLAQENFAKKDLKAAATEIKNASSSIKMEAERATEQGKKELTDVVNDLEKFAGEVEKGTIDSSKKLNNEFAKVYYSLSRYYLDKAKESWEKKDARLTARNLRVITNHLEEGMISAEQKIEGDTATVIKDARSASAKLSGGAEWSAEESSKLFENLGKEIEKFGQAIKPKESAEPVKQEKVEQATEKVEKAIEKAGGKVEKAITPEKAEKTEK